MTKAYATHCFIKSCYGDLENLHNALQKDWLAVQQDWEIYVDQLCRNGHITMQQYDSWVFPWRR